MIVGAINVATGVMEYFRSRQPGGLTFEHVAASGSLPPSFPMTPIGEHRYWDGGLFSNTPLGPAINALEEARAATAPSSASSSSSSCSRCGPRCRGPSPTC